MCKVLCLLTQGRSGSKLFHSLLDSHPQILMFPRSLHFSRFWKKVEDRKRENEYIVDLFVKDHPRFFSGIEWKRINKFDRADNLGPDMNETFFVDKNNFKKHAISMMSGKRIERRDFFKIAHKAYRLATGKNLPKSTIILNHIHTTLALDEVEACLEDFRGNTRLLLMARHPIESLNSCVKIQKLRNTLSCAEVSLHQRETLLGASEIIRRFPALDAKVLPFELLHMKHRDVMEEFTKWMDIRWDNSLMQSTMRGKLWWGNGEKPQSGTNPRWEIYKPKGFLENKDWRIFCSLTGKRMHSLGYAKWEKRKPSRLTKAATAFLLFLPMKVEWELLKSIFRPKYWITVIDNIKKSGDTHSFWMRLLRNIHYLNPVKWIYHIMKRYAFYYSFSRKPLVDQDAAVLRKEASGQ